MKNPVAETICTIFALFMIGMLFLMFYDMGTNAGRADATRDWCRVTHAGEMKADVCVADDLAHPVPWHAAEQEKNQ